ncbi:alternate signal-mediated exported protein [Psychromicrobium silvestre]|uniref:Alternate signal-mediated exported protein n=1 Tax=Psychromicrobium silvestre TaxID=1645614 RepID=A0A7Y9S927_9MICC|nr:alternate-type signal peptide domain-containing protein [Psychromicrobium silvestre]NYE96576.1 alternate signal-mediated exported protein [Psychromicrobium silvestre]
MNKVAKAGVAAGIAGILLLGGAGTYALWQDSKTVDAGTVQTGQLKLNLGAAGVWKDVSTDVTGAPTIDPATFKLVPGDTIAFTQNLTILASGNNLKGQLTIDQSTVQAAIPVAWQPYITITVAPANLPAGITNTAGVLSFSAPGSYTFDVGITVAFAKGTNASGTDDETIENQSANLNGLALKLEQIRP